jgi:hypothetical protein
METLRVCAAMRAEQDCGTLRPATGPPAAACGVLSMAHSSFELRWHRRGDTHSLAGAAVNKSLELMCCDEEVVLRRLALCMVEPLANTIVAGPAPSKQHGISSSPLLPALQVLGSSLHFALPNAVQLCPLPLGDVTMLLHWATAGEKTLGRESAALAKP